MKKSLILVITLILLLSVLLAGCSFAWDEEEEKISIEKIERIVDKDGKTFMVIHYVGSENVDRFELPEGNGIAEVKYDYDDENKVTLVTLIYTNGSTAKIQVPYGKDGEQGISFYKIEPATDLGGAPYFYFYTIDSDGNISDPQMIDVSILKGKDGVDGLGIKKWEPFTDEIGEGVVITLSDDSEPFVYYFNYYKDISCEVVGDQFIITIANKNGSSSQVIYLDRFPTWLSGTTLPNDSEGIVGDFYFDTRRQVIYTKVDDEGGSYWKEVARLNSEQNNKATVTFDPVNGTIPGFETYEVQGKYVFEVNYGHYFLDDYPAMPTPVLEGYTFKGWYRNFITGVGEVQFNDFVQITGDLTLYAKWEKNV